MAQFESTSVSLLERARDQQPDAWEKLVELYAPLVHYWCRRSGLSGEDLADVFQDVFQAVAQHLEKFRREQEGSTFRGWLRVITQNKVRDHFRQIGQEPPALGGSVAQEMAMSLPDPITDEPVEVSLMQERLTQALDWVREEIEERTWQAFHAVQFDHRDPKEVGEELGMTAAAVRKARYRVLRRLREELDGLYP